MDIKNIYVYKIDFGDCSLLELDNVNILVDCGGDIKELEKTVLVNDIISKTLNKNLECIVTHFHDDIIIILYLCSLKMHLMQYMHLTFLQKKKLNYTFMHCSFSPIQVRAI